MHRHKAADPPGDMRAPALKTATALLAAAATAAIVGSTLSAFSSASSNVGSTFATAATFDACDGTTVTNGFVSGVETGRRGYAATALTMTATASPDGAAGAARSGNYSLKVAATGAATSYGTKMWDTAPYPAHEIARFAMRLDTLPTTDITQLFAITTSGGGVAQLRYLHASNRFAMAIRGTSSGTFTTVNGFQGVVAGHWYVMDVHYDVSSPNHTINWQVDGAAQPPISVLAGTQSATYQTIFGTQYLDVLSAHYDDMLVSPDPAEYPLGDGRVYVLKPNGMGTSVGTSVKDDDGTDIDASSWQRIDEIPTDATNDFIQQISAVGTDYAEIAFENTSATCIRAVHGVFSTHSPSSNKSNDIKVSVFDGATESILRDGDIAANVTVSRDYGGKVTPATSWTPTAVNGIVARFGYSGGANPVPVLDNILLEYEVPQ